MHINNYIANYNKYIYNVEKQEKATNILNKIAEELKNHENFAGIEVAVLKVGETYTSDLCIRVLVNSKEVTHEDLNLPVEIEGFPVRIKYGPVELHNDDGVTNKDYPN